MQTYTELVAAIADFLNRDDLTVAIPSFVQLAHAQLEKEVVHWRREVRQDAEIDSRYIGVPADFREVIRWEILSGGLIARGSRDAFVARRAGGDVAGAPQEYALSGGALEVWPTPDRVYSTELLYKAALPKIGPGGDETSWLLQESPGCYLYGALRASAPYLHDDARLQLWDGLYSQCLAAVNASGDAAYNAGTGGALRMRVRGMGV